MVSRGGAFKFYLSLVRYEVLYCSRVTCGASSLSSVYAELDRSICSNHLCYLYSEFLWKSLQRDIQHRACPQSKTTHGEFCRDIMAVPDCSDNDCAEGH